MQVSFAEFILRYLDNWNMESGLLADDLNISTHTLNDWTYRNQIPNPYNIEIIKNYFQEDFKDVVFDGKAYRRKFKVIRPDGSSQVYPAIQQLVWGEGVAYTTIVKCLQEDIAVGRGKQKGYRFEKVYIEEEQEHGGGIDMYDRYMNDNENNLSDYTKSTNNRRRRAIDSDVERTVDKIYDDVQEIILDWKTDHAVKRHGATPVDYSYHRAGTMKYGESIIEAIAEELLGRIIVDGELNETTFLEEY